VLSNDIDIVGPEVRMNSVAQFGTWLGVKSDVVGSTLRHATLTVRKGVPESSIMSVLGLSMTFFQFEFNSILLLLVSLFVFLCTGL
jgi:hypothetical protein